MKHVVKLEILAAHNPNKQWMVVHLNERKCGRYLVGTDASVVENALLLLGFQSVEVVGEDGEGTRHTLDNFRGDQISLVYPRPANLGDFRLTRRWSEPLEAYRLELTHNGCRLPSTDANMNLDTLRAILVRLGFTIGLIEEPALAA